VAKNLLICRTKHLDSNLLLLVWKIFINLGDNISEAFKGRHLFMWSHRKPELRKISDQGFSKMAVIETQMEMRTFMYQLHDPVYPVKS